MVYTIIFIGMQVGIRAQNDHRKRTGIEDQPADSGPPPGRGERVGRRSSHGCLGFINEIPGGGVERPRSAETLQRNDADTWAHGCPKSALFVTELRNTGTMLRLRVRNLQELREKHQAGDYVSGKCQGKCSSRLHA